MIKITEVTVELVDIPAHPPFRWRDGLPGPDPAVVGAKIRVHTDQGVIGEAGTNRGVIAKDYIDRRIRGELTGQDALRREYLWHRMWELDRIERFPVWMIGLIDIALWDIAGKAAGLPVHQLMGHFREQIPAYASTATYSSIEEYLDVADQCLERGVHGIKLHAWGDARRDAELSQKLRAHVGDGLALMYDGSAGFTLPDAVYLGRALHEAGYLWYEEPMREFSVTAYKRLGEAVSVPLLVGEVAEGAHMNTADFIASGCAQYVRISAGLRGGYTGALRTAHLADSFLLKAEVHGGDRHLTMAIPNTTYYEAFVYGNPIVLDPAVESDGMVHAPTTPGV